MAFVTIRFFSRGVFQALNFFPNLINRFCKKNKTYMRSSYEYEQNPDPMKVSKYTNKNLIHKKKNSS